MTFAEDFMATDRSAYEWTVDSIGVHPDGRVILCSKDGCAGQDFGRLVEIVKERDELRKENRNLKSDIAYRDRVIDGVRAKHDELKAENETTLNERARLISGNHHDGMIIHELQAENDKLKEEARLSKEREAESDARLEWYQAEREAQEKRIEGLTALNRRTHDDLQAVCHDRRALREERDNLKEENRRLKHENDSYSRIFGVGDIVEIPPPMKPGGCGYVNPPRVEIKGKATTPPITGTIEDLVASGVVTLGNEEVKRLEIDLGQAAPMAILKNIKPLLQGLGSSPEIAGAISVAAVTLFTLWEQVKNDVPRPPKD